MSSNAQLYLFQMQNLAPNPKTHQKVKHLNSTLLNDIGNEIIHSRIVIPEHQKKLKLKTLHEENDLAKIDGKYSEIKLKKKALLEELEAVQTMENTFKLNISTIKQSSVSSHHPKQPKFKSQFTQQQITKIKQIYNNQQKFKRKLQSKLKKYQQDLQLYKNQQVQQQKQKHRNLCMEKHEQREKYIKEIQLRNKQRQEMLKEQREKIAQLKNKQKLFQRLQDNFLKEKQLQSEQLKLKLQEHKRKRQFSFEDMKRHQEEYMERKRAKDEQRQQNLRNFKNVNETRFPCLFLDKIREQEVRAALEDEERRQMAKDFVQRKTAYAQEVRKQLQNKIKTLSESKLSAVKQTKIQPKWLNTPQKYQQGTKYMRQINSKLSKKPYKAPQHPVNETKPKFKNYLIEMKNQDQDKKREAREKKVDNIVSSVGIIAAKQNITTINLAKSVKAKLDLMCKLQNLQ